MLVVILHCASSRKIHKGEGLLVLCVAALKIIRNFLTTKSFILAALPTLIYLSEE